MEPDGCRCCRMRGQLWFPEAGRPWRAAWRSRWWASWEWRCCSASHSLRLLQGWCRAVREAWWAEPGQAQGAGSRAAAVGSTPGLSCSTCAEGFWTSSSLDRRL